MKIHRFLSTVLPLLVVSAFAASPVEDLAKTAAAQSGAQRAIHTDKFISAIESADNLTPEQQLHLLWLARDLSTTPEQFTRILKMAGKVPSNMARPLIFEFRSYKNLLTAYRNALNDSNKVLLGDRQPSKGGGAGYSVAIYGSNPYDARYDFDKWEDPHGFIGRYVDDKNTLRVDVVAKPANNFHARLWIDGGESPLELVGFIGDNGKLHLIGPGVDAMLTPGGTMEMRAPQQLSLKRVAVGKVSDKPIPEGAIVLLGKDSKDLSAFRSLEGRKGTWKLDTNGVVESAPPGAGSLTTAENYTDLQIYLEFRVPYNAEALGQMRGNSGIIIANLYEVQILDSFGLDPKENEAGGVYHVAPPSLNMAAPPLEWQSYFIDFTAPRYDDSGKKIQNARVSVWHNGVKIQDNTEIPYKTSNMKPDFMQGAQPTSIQEHSNRIQFRNIWVLPKNK